MDIVSYSIAANNRADIQNGQHIFVEKISDIQLNIWMKTPKGKWMIYQFRRTRTAETAEVNQDVWRVYDFQVGDISGVDPLPGGKTLINSLGPMTSATQWEYAIQPQGAPDFFGGYHGDELLQLATFMIDGKPLDVLAMAVNSVRVCRRFEIAQKTFVYDPTNNTTKLGDMFVRHIFTSESLELKWKLNWVASATIISAYAGMLPIRRSATTSTSCRFLLDPTTYDISVTPHSVPKSDTYGIELWNTNNKLSARLEFDSPSFFNNFTNSNGQGIWVTDSATYNKVYPTRVLIPKTETVTAGQSWECSMNYRLTFLT